MLHSLDPQRVVVTKLQLRPQRIRSFVVRSRIPHTLDERFKQPRNITARLVGDLKIWMPSLQHRHVARRDGRAVGDGASPLIDRRVKASYDARGAVRRAMRDAFWRARRRLEP